MMAKDQTNGRQLLKTSTQLKDIATQSVKRKRERVLFFLVVFLLFYVGLFCGRVCIARGGGALVTADGVGGGVWLGGKLRERICVGGQVGKLKL